MTTLIDLTDATYGRLTVVRRGPDAIRNGRKRARWYCKCECGVVTLVRGDDLRKGDTTSCGCRQREVGFENRKTVVTYSGAHQRVGRERGKASTHACVDCDGTADEWSYDGTDSEEFEEFRSTRGNGYLVPFSVDPMHYSPRCLSCHRKRDNNNACALVGG